MSVVADPVPSTFDVPLTAEPADDPVLAVLRHARDRIRVRHAVGHYMGNNGSVCALGACFREDMTRAEFWESEVVDIELPEQWLKETTCNAIRALDAIAVELYPASMYMANDGTWLGSRIEDVNEDDTVPVPERKRRVLHCYSVAIERQKALA